MTKYTATHEGQTFTRKSDRTYTHVVVATGNPDFDIASVHGRANSDSFINEYEYFCREANETTRKYDNHSPAQIAEFKRVAAMTLVEYRNEWVAERMAKIEAHRQAGLYEKYNVVGWCGRPDLAVKSAASARAKAWNKDVKIIPVTAQD